MFADDSIQIIKVIFYGRLYSNYAYMRLFYMGINCAQKVEKARLAYINYRTCSNGIGLNRG